MKKGTCITSLALSLVVILSATASNASAGVSGDAGGVAEEIDASLLVELPVKAVYRKQLENGHARDVVGVVHAVRRVPGATIVYASQGFSEHENSPHFGKEEWDDMYGEDGSFSFAAMVDPIDKRYWFPYRVENTPVCLCPTDSVRPVYRYNVNDEDSGNARDGLWTFAIAYPPLPDNVESVDLSITGDGKFVTNIPVEQGVLEPMSQPEEDVKEESFRYFQKVRDAGWPYIPSEGFFQDTINVTELPKNYRDTEVPLEGEINEYIDDLAQGVDKRTQGAEAEYTVSADVAFDFDSATLSTAAITALEQAVQDFGEGASSVQVFGYTDSQGADDYNDDLSQRRAAAVADAIRGKLQGAEFQVKGLGEKNPIADNTSEEGRSQNRRVVVTITK